MLRLAAFVREQNRSAPERPVFVGHNAVFDWSYIAYYYAHFGMENPFGYKGLDTKSLAMGVLGIPWSDTSKEVLERLLSLPPQDRALVHRADYDAAYQARILQALLDRGVPPRLDTPARSGARLTDFSSLEAFLDGSSAATDAPLRAPRGLGRARGRARG